MLVRLEIENFFSFRDRQVLDLSVARNVPDMPGRFAEPLPGLRVAKVAVVFGPNASGKTNLLRALTFLRWFVRDSFAALPEPYPRFASFRSPDGESSRTRMEVRFICAIAENAPRSLHRYVIEIENQPGAPSVVLHESLSDAPLRKLRRLFRRERQDIEGSREFSLSRAVLRSGPVRPNASVVSTLAHLNHAPSQRIARGLDTIVANFESAPTDGQAAEFYARNPESLIRLNRLLPTLDFGLTEAKVQSGPAGVETLFVHGGIGTMPMLLESEGTRRFFRSFPWIDVALTEGGIALIDEVDTATHPVLLPEILRWFHDPERNPHEAQLLATCHNPYLLEDLDKEEVWFTEKDGQGRTSLFGLKDIEGIRRQDRFARKYLDGVLGALPRIG